MIELKVGQSLWFVPNGISRRGDPREVTVIKVGHKWVTLDIGNPPYRMAKGEMSVDGKGYMSPGRCYLSREEYESEVAVLAAWCDLVTLINTRSPDGMTLEKIKEIKSLLFGEPA